MRDLHHNIKAVPGIGPRALADNTPVTTGWIDRAGFESLEFLIAAGALPDADATFTVLVEDADASNQSDAAAAPDRALLGTELAAGFAFSADNTVRQIGYVGDKQYVRLTITPANVASGAEQVCVIPVKGNPRRAPVA